MSKTDSQPILVLGMHRSGTSYLASLLQALGLHIGDELLGPQKGNPRGHFEAVPILNFHQQLIRNRGAWPRRAFDKDMLVGVPFDRGFSDEETAQAEQILDALRQPCPWGWKEPRTCLFLPEWRQLLPQMRAVGVYRHPLEVHQSLLRREHWDLPLFPDQAMRAYEIYNRELLGMPADQLLLIEANSAFADVADTAAWLQQKLSLTPATHPLPEFHSGEFHSLRISEPMHRLFALIYPSTAEVYETLQERANRPGSWATRDDDDFWEAWHARLAPVMAAVPEAGRCHFGPLLDALTAEQGEAVYETYSSLAEAIGNHVQNAIEWNNKAEQIFAENEAFVARFNTLSESFVRQQKELDELHRVNKKIWGELTWTGNSWKEQRRIIDDLMEENKKLKERLDSSNDNSPPSASR